MAMGIDVVDRAPTLDELAYTINREHSLTLSHAQGLLEHAIKAGEALIAMRAIVPYGQWQRWTEANTALHIEQARGYVRMAKYKHLLTGVETRDAAKRMLHGLDYAHPVRPAPEWISDAKKMREQGMTHGGPATVQSALNPKWREDAKVRYRRLRARRAAERAALKREQRAALAKAQGGGVADAHHRILRLAKIFAALESDGATPEIRKCAAVSLHELYRIEDRVIRALGGA